MCSAIYFVLSSAARGRATMAGGYTDSNGRIQTNVTSGANDAIASSSVPPSTRRWHAGQLQLLIAEHFALAGVVLEEAERGEQGEW